MSVKEKGLWLLAAVILVFLYLASSTDLIIKEKVVRIHPVSIILDDINDDYYQNFKKGADHAAREYHGDISYTTMYRQGAAGEQIELVNREIEDGAEALIAVPVDGSELEQALDEKKYGVPFVIFGSQVVGDEVNVHIELDSMQAGRLLAEQAAKELPEDVVCYLFAQDLSLGDSRLVYEGVKSVLEEAGIEYVLKEKKDEEGLFRATVESAIYPATTEHAAVIALDRKSLTETADILKTNGTYRNYLWGVYGVGCTTSLLNSMDAGLIDGLVTYNQYLAGYLSVQKAVEAISLPGRKETIPMELYYITRENMRDRRYEKMLYPME